MSEMIAGKILDRRDETKKCLGMDMGVKRTAPADVQETA